MTIPTSLTPEALRKYWQARAQVSAFQTAGDSGSFTTSNPADNCFLYTRQRQRDLKTLVQFGLFLKGRMLVGRFAAIVNRAKMEKSQGFVLSAGRLTAWSAKQDSKTRRVAPSQIERHTYRQG